MGFDKTRPPAALRGSPERLMRYLLVEGNWFAR
jgi:hypothetical protein